jgi:RNA polymerase sigma factor (sigma-70 family)
MDDELNLLDGILRGEEGAARVFVDRYKFVVWGVFRRFTRLTAQDREDLFSELHEKFWEHDCRRLRKLRDEWRGGSLEGYVRRAAHNLAIDKLREMAAKPEDDVEDPELLADQKPIDPGSDPVFLIEVRRMIELALKKLTEQCQKAVRLVHFLDLPYAEAASAMEMTVSDFGVRLKRCREGLAKVIDHEFPALRTYLAEGL